MRSDAHPTAAQDKQERLAAALSLVTDLPKDVSRDELAEFGRRYFARYDAVDLAARPPETVAGMLMAHLRLGVRRVPGEDALAVFTPTVGDVGWDAQGCTLVQIVTDDRPFLVDTVLMDLTSRSWTVRRLYHPQFAVVRDGEGALVDIEQKAADAPGCPESWIGMEVYPPLGEVGADLTGALADGLADGLAKVREGVDDWAAMRTKADDCVEMLDNTPQPVSPHRVRGVISLLRWLAEDRFAFLGYREYRVDGTTFAPVPGTGLGILRGDGNDPGSFGAIAPGRDDEDILVVTKDSRRSPVHRRSYLDYVGVRVFDRSGTIVGEHRFLGLLSSAAYTEPVRQIPLLADKAAQLSAMSGFDPDSHGGHAVAQIITTYPRDELFQASVEELFPIIDTVVNLQERRQVRAFVRPGTYGRFFSCTVYLPRDRYNTSVRLRIQGLLMQTLGGESLEYQAMVSESVLARLFFVVKLPDGRPIPAVDVAALEARINDATRSWDDRFSDEAVALPSEQRGVQFGESYEASFTASEALADLRLANALADDDDLRFSLYTRTDDTLAQLRFKVITRRLMSLTDVMPHLAALGVEVTDELPFEWDLRGRPTYVYDFGFRLRQGESPDDWDPADRERFCAAFAASYRGLAHAGRMNSLVMAAKLTWQQVSWLRGIGRYLQQAPIPFSQPYVADALTDNPAIAAALVEAFTVKFDPGLAGSLEQRTAAFEEKVAAIEQALDGVASLDQDRILRMYLAVMRALTRTNAFAADAPALTFKIRPRKLALPQPRPEIEIFVWSPRVQGVHLRFGAVARGGLRWSDRKEDFRTEVLGLVKAQMVKNAVIVPVGAKGGFVPLRLPDPKLDRAGWQEEGTACYRLFVGSLLSVTDNRVDGGAVAPPDVVRYDGDDSYLVVAADKGTATFSDAANALALERGFWLGDAFASGGSAGFDHKGMGITARGAWESVKRHFFELGVDPQAEDITCVGIGDMAGDVFGNGMLRSEHIRLVAAFNHQHVFVDPDPDAGVSFAERQRLYRLPRSTWADYDAALISAGGGVYERSAKSIRLSPQARTALGIEGSVRELTPAALITAILRAPVDLFWNGGIGTYVKAVGEGHADVGDKANDAVRVNGREVRAKVAVEGGNLGWTQQGRIEFALAGGRINADFIDNSAGVDTSDHEVNIKILLSPEVKEGRLTLTDRNALLESMTEEVAQLVLTHNVDQNLALAAASHRAHDLAGAHESWMGELERTGHLDRWLESLPTTSDFLARRAAGGGLTRPELATLLAATKIRLEELVLASTLPDDPYLADRLNTYFPQALRERYGDRMRAHPLAREIVATVTVNRFVNSQGISAFHRLAEETQSSVEQIVRAQLAARTILGIAGAERDLTRLEIGAETDTAVRVSLQRLVERATRWLLHNRRGTLDIRQEAEAFTTPVDAVRGVLPELLTPRQRRRAQSDEEALVAGGVETVLARAVATARYAHMALPVVQTAGVVGRDVELVAEVYFALADELRLDLVTEGVNDIRSTSRWDTMARAALRDELQALHGELTRAALAAAPGAADAADIVAAWRATVGGAREQVVLLEQVCDGAADVARMSVALRTIRSLLV